MSNIPALVAWFCSQLTPDELLEALTILLEVFGGTRDDIRLRSTFRQDHPNYRQYRVDTQAPLTERAPPPVRHERSSDWRELLARHRQDTGRELQPVTRHPGSRRPPADTCCEHCGAPAAWLYVNDGAKCSQVRCRVCSRLSPVRRSRRQATCPLRCPHCGQTLYEWKHDEERTTYKCGNDNCPHYLANLRTLNARERLLVRTGMGSQFKLRYQWRSYHHDLATIHPCAPRTSSLSLLRIHRSLEAVGLALAYAVSLGLSARMTAQALRDIHGIEVSHQTVLNWLEAAAVPAWHSLERLKGSMTEALLAADETYIKVQGLWHYTWFVIGVESRIVWAWHVSDNRGERPAIAVLNRALESRPPEVAGTLVLASDGNPAYDAAVNALNTENGLPLPADRRRIERRAVIGLSNDDEQSTLFRACKQIIERLNRTYRYHTRSRSGHKSDNGARALTTLFVAHMNFLRPHRSLGDRPPIQLPELKDIKTLQGRWLKLLQPAA